MQPDPLVGIETPGMGEGEWITRQTLELGARRTKEIGARELRIVIRLDRTERVGNGAEKRPGLAVRICALRAWPSLSKEVSVLGSGSDNTDNHNDHCHHLLSEY